MTNRNYNLEADSAGGGCIQGFTGTELVIDEPSLYALDILDAPQLETITIKSLDTGKPPHLVLGNLPALRRVSLPGSHPGAVIHLHTTSAPTLLEITGPVSEIDAAWPGVQLRNETRPGEHDWQTVRLGQPVQNEHRLNTPSLNIMFGQLPAREAKMSLDGDGDWHLVGIKGLRLLNIHAAGSVTLQQLDSLEAIHSSDNHVKLEIIDACNLTEVTGTGQNLSLRQNKAHAPALTTAGDWTHLRIASAHLQSLICKGGQSLELHHCRALKTIDLPQGMEVECHGALPAPLANRARFFFNESTLTESLKAYRNGDSTQLPTLLHVLSHASESNPAVQALIKLAELCDLGVNPETIWNTRRELSARHLSRSRKNVVVDGSPSPRALAKADRVWNWHFPEDLAPQAWQADLDIWSHCHKTVESAYEYTGTMAHTCTDPVALEVLIRRADNDIPVSPLRKLLITTIRAYLRRGDDFLLDSQRTGNNDLAIRLGRLLQAPDMNGRDQQTLVTFLIDALPLERTLKSVPKVMHLAPGLFRSELMAAARKPDRWIRARLGWQQHFSRGRDLEDVRQNLMGLALSPTTKGAEAGASDNHTYSLFGEEA